MSDRSLNKFWVGQNYMVKDKLQLFENSYPDAELSFEKAISCFEDLRDKTKITEVMTEKINLYYISVQKDKALDTINKLPTQKKSISKRIYEKLIVAKMKIELLLNEKIGLLDKDEITNLRCTDFEQKFDTYSTAAKYFKHVVDNYEQSKEYANQANDVFKHLINESPEDIKSSLLKDVRFLNFFKEFNLPPI